MNTIERTISVSPVSVEVHQAPALTKGQRNIIALLNECIRENRVLTRMDIVKCWIKSQCKDGLMYYTGFEPYVKADGTVDWRYKQCHKVADPDGSHERMVALPWFKNNLGSCILKGGLLAIPVIDLNDQAA